MTPVEPDITVTFTAREARALSHAADFLDEVCEGLQVNGEVVPTVPPLQSAEMKLETRAHPSTSRAMSNNPKGANMNVHIVTIALSVVLIACAAIWMWLHA